MASKIKIQFLFFRQQPATYRRLPKRPKSLKGFYAPFDRMEKDKVIRARDVKSNKWFVRVTYPHDVLIERKEKILGWVDLVSVLAYLHVSKKEKDHGHLCIELSSTISQQAMLARFKNIWPVKGNDICVKVWDGNDGAETYLFHELTQNQWMSKGYTEDEIQVLEEKGISIAKAVEINKQKAPGRKIDQVVERLRLNPEKPNSHDIGMEFLRMIRTGEMYEPGDYRLLNMIEEVKLKLCRTDEEFIDYGYARLNNILRRV